MVFVFFGLTGVFGSYYLQTGLLEWMAFLPAISVGLFSTGVLNMNNLRDTENDKACGKITIPVRIGVKATKVYQALLILLGLAASYAYFFLLGATDALFWLLPALLLFVFHLLAVFKEKQFKGFDKQLKICVLATLVYGICFAGYCFSTF